MRKFVILASIVVLAASSVNCANSGERANSLVGPSAQSADARKPGAGNGQGGGSSLTLAMVDDGNGDGLPNFGETITFNVTTTVSGPQVDVVCSQNGTRVYWAQQLFYGDGSRNFTLASMYWTGGAANCTATLDYQTAKGIASLAAISFDAGE